MPMFSKGYLEKERKEYLLSRSRGISEGKAAHEKLESKKKELAEKRAMMGPNAQYNTGNMGKRPAKTYPLYKLGPR